ncbi:hypothetical protein [Sphingomonas parva]|uniref:hypothetical protein n=1 Tax=Sphingomonas parva TaxID=2555898 RepID=UPI001074365A|nr:hypothetical protein [Sphingomonas parva]
MRIIGGLVAGFVIALVAIFGVSWVNQLLYPALGTVSMADRNNFGAIIESSGVGAQLIFAISWFAGAFVGGWVAGAISGRRWALWTIAGLILLNAAASALLGRYPPLLQVSAIIAPLLGGWLAGALLRRTPSAGMGAPA